MTFMTPTPKTLADAKPVSVCVSDTMIIVPCYNEADRLSEDVFLKTLAEHAQLSFVFVNDGSTDATLQQLLTLQMSNPRQIDVISLEQNSGKAEAVRVGLAHASQIGAKLIGYWDADLATPLDAISDFETVMDRYADIDVVYGARRQLLGRRINRTFTRRTVSRICAGLARLAVGLPISDTQCGAKLLRNTPELRAAVENRFTAGWLFDVELFTRIAEATKNKDRRFYEMPLAEWFEVEGSKVSGRAIARSGIQMLRLIARRYAGMLSNARGAAPPNAKLKAA